LRLDDLDAALVGAFLEDLENRRHNGARSRNLRLTAIRSFFRYASLEAPAHGGIIQRVLAIPNQRQRRALVGFLTRPEIEALLAAPNRTKWLGRRDHAFLITAVQTGLRLSEMTGLRHEDVSLGAGAHVRCRGKGRKERCTPLAKPTAAILKARIREQGRNDSKTLFPSTRGGPLSADGVQHLLARHVAQARKNCTSLRKKRVSPHVLRHAAAMELLQAGVDRAVIALWLGHESVETTQITRCRPRVEGTSLGQNQSGQRRCKTLPTGRRVAGLPQTTLIPNLWTMPHVERLARKQPCTLRAFEHFVLILAA